MDNYRVFIGYDPRQPVAYNVAQYSVARNASKPVSITPLILDQLPIKRRGVTEFTFSRFLVPYLMGYRGKGMFMDADMVVTGDVCELIDSCGCDAAVHVVQDQPRFEWPSMMVFCNARCRTLKPEYIDDEENTLFDFKWANAIGEIPKEWNHCVGYEEPRSDAKLYHYTCGLPCWPETQEFEPSYWMDEFKQANSTVSWKELMGNTVHARKVRADG